jgi:predicted phage terminase large subunit-like protein
LNRIAEWPTEYLSQVAREVGAYHDWRPRDTQRQPDGDWFLWFVRAGRGFGKTRTAAELVADWLKDAALAGTPIRVAIVGPTFADGRDTMVEGDSGLLGALPAYLIPDGPDRHWNRSIGELNLADGSYCRVHSSERSGRLRGPQWHKAWCDEPAEFRDGADGIAKDSTVFNLFAGLRLGDLPQVVFTGTPKPTRLVKELVARCETEGTWIETRGSTYDNLDNLALAFRQEVVSLYEGSRLGRQELLGEMLEDLGDVFDVSKIQVVEALPTGRRYRARCWDLAASEKSPENADPDWTAGALVSVDPATRDYCIEDVIRFRERAGRRNQRILETALADNARYSGAVPVWVEHEPGSGGKAQVEQIAQELDGVTRVQPHRPSGAKYQRALPVAGSIDQGRVSVFAPDPNTEWVRELLEEMAEFAEDDTHPHDDMVDALSSFWAVAPKRAPKDRGVLPGSVSERRGYR